MYKVIDDDGVLLSNNTFKTKKDAKEFIIWHFRCLKRDGFLEGYTLRDFQKECLIEKTREIEFEVMEHGLVKIKTENRGD